MKAPSPHTEMGILTALLSKVFFRFLIFTDFFGCIRLGCGTCDLHCSVQDLGAAFTGFSS